MPDEKENEVSKRGLSNLEREWMNHQRQSRYVQDVQRREVGILRDAKSGPEFLRYVTDELGKATDKTACADNIVRELSKDNRYLINAATNPDGRRGLEALRTHISYDDQGKALLGNIDKALGLTRPEPGQNKKNFEDNFPKYEAELKKQLESQGIEVNKAYYKKFTEYQVEIRAEVKEFAKGVKVERMGGGSERIYTGTRDILVGGYDYETGKFVPPSTMEKHGTAESSFLQGDDILFVAIAAARKTAELAFRQLGKGLAREAVDLAKVAGRDALKTASKEGGKDVGRLLSREAVNEARKSAEGAMDTAEDLSKTLKWNRPPARERSSAKLSKGRDTEQDLGDTLKGEDFKPKSSGADRPPIGRSVTKEPSPFSEMDIKYLGEDTARKARDVGMTKDELTSYVEDQIQAAAHWDPGRIATGAAAQEAKAKIQAEMDNLASLGRDTTRRLMDYGYDPERISQAMKVLREEGLRQEQIKRYLNDQAKLMDHLRNKYCGGDINKARAELTVSDNPREAMKNIIWGDLSKQRASQMHKNPELQWSPEKRAASNAEMQKRAEEMTEKEVSRVLGPGAASPFVLPRPEATKGGRDKKEKESGQRRDGSEKERGAHAEGSKSGAEQRQEANTSDHRQGNDRQANAKRDNDEREVRKAASREVGSTASNDSRERDTGEGEPKGEDKDKGSNRE